MQLMSNQWSVNQRRLNSCEEIFAKSLNAWKSSCVLQSKQFEPVQQTRIWKFGWQYMADFKTHISTSTALGVVFGGAGYFLFDIPVAHALVAGSLCSVAGMLPDLDSKSGIPQREMLCFVSVITPMLMLPRLDAFGLTTEHKVFVAGVMYVLVRFGIGGLFRRFTKHRGMWHSIPAAMIAGLATFMICLSTDFNIRLFKAWAVVLGFVSHLFLDEIYAVNWEGKLPSAKKSFGTAMKFFGRSTFFNVMIYAKLAVLIFVVVSDDYIMECVCDPEHAPTQILNRFIVRFLPATNRTVLRISCGYRSGLLRVRRWLSERSCRLGRRQFERRCLCRAPSRRTLRINGWRSREQLL